MMVTPLPLSSPSQSLSLSSDVLRWSSSSSFFISSSLPSSSSSLLSHSCYYLSNNRSSQRSNERCKHYYYWEREHPKGISRMGKTSHWLIQVLIRGWYAVIGAMIISCSSGEILKKAVGMYPGIAVFQPLVNGNSLSLSILQFSSSGIGGNIVAVQASRISTSLHQGSKLKSEDERGIINFCSPWRAFFSRGSFLLSLHSSSSLLPFRDRFISSSNSSSSFSILSFNLLLYHFPSSWTRSTISFLPSSHFRISSRCIHPGISLSTIHSSSPFILRWELFSFSVNGSFVSYGGRGSIQIHQPFPF